jgi:hypothetical protein
MAVDPIAGDEPGEDGAVDAARRTQIDIFDTCVLAQRGELEARRKTFGVSLGSFTIDKKSDALFERQGIEIRYCRCSSKALAIPVKPSVISRSWVGCVSIGVSLVQWK